MSNLNKLKIKIFADGAKIKNISKFSKYNWISGFTTNPTIISKEKIKNYVLHCKKLVAQSNGKPISFEVLSDSFEDIYNQAIEMSKWGKNVYVKIPIVNSSGLSTDKIINKLSNENVKLNITAVFTYEQIKQSLEALNHSNFSIISVFAGRIADTGIDPEVVIKKSVKLRDRAGSNSKILWASSREIFNIFQAERSGADIITVSDDLIEKIHFIGKDLYLFSKETSKMFITDAEKSGLSFQNKFK